MVVRRKYATNCIIYLKIKKIKMRMRNGVQFNVGSHKVGEFRKKTEAKKRKRSGQ